MNRLKRLVKKILPDRLLRGMLFFVRVHLLGEWRLWRAFYSDLRRYRRYSSTGLQKGIAVENLNAKIIMEAHALEKGFSLPEIRPGYGSERIRKLIYLMQQYERLGYDCNGLAIQKARSVLAEYIRYHNEIGFDLGEFAEIIFPWVDAACDIGGYIRLDRSSLLVQSKSNFQDCALSRFSIRSYSEVRVPGEVIADAVQIASKTPSVCNRQPWHVYIIKNAELKQRVLELQNGNRGFGKQADFLAVITGDMRSFSGPGERNESYVDGGLFAMSLMYAFHFKGIASCPLNWMVEPSVDRRLRMILNIGPSENIIMIIAAGNLPKEVRVAKSARKSVGEIMTVLE